MLGDAALWDDVAPALAERAALRFARIDLDDSVAGHGGQRARHRAGALRARGPLARRIVALEVVRQAPGRVTRLALLNASARPANDAAARELGGDA